MERARREKERERERERDLKLNLRGSPQARRRQVPRPPRKTTPLRFKHPFFLPFSSPLSAMNRVPTLLLLYLFCIRSLSCPLFVPHSLLPWSFVSIFTSSPFPLSLSFPLFLFLSRYSTSIKSRGTAPGRSYNPWTRKPDRSLCVCVCMYALINPLVIPPSQLR